MKQFIEVRVSYKISFWEAIKLRIAGKPYQTVATNLIEMIKIQTVIKK